MIAMAHRAFLALFLLLFCQLAAAHQQGSSYSRWQLGDSPRVELRISELDLTRAALHPVYTPNYEDEAAAYLQAHLQLWQGGNICRPSAAAVTSAQPGWLLLSWPFNCPLTEDAAYRIESMVLLSQAPGHLHFVRLQDNENTFDRLLTARSSSWQIDSTPTSSGFLEYLKQGVIHILEGWDHLAFVLVLLLLARSLRALLWLVTGFTLGHSVTLVLATLGWLQPNIALIEAVIAWSIALVATEVLWQKWPRLYWVFIPIFMLVLPLLGASNSALWLGLALFSVAYFVALKQRPDISDKTRAAVTVSFGLIHGCGFASVLYELGLPADAIALSLFGFNLGVEVGQILVVALAWPLLRVATKTIPPLPQLLAYTLLALASFWWFERLV